jgi:hypothetical protein
MTLTLTASKPPFPLPQGDADYLIVDGALFPDIKRWLYTHGTTELPVAVLADGQYDALEMMGPVLIPLPEDSQLAGLWEQRHEDLKTATVLRFNGSFQTLLEWLRARSQIRLPDGRVVWLRLGDATVIKRMLDNVSHTPGSFWSGISDLSLAAPDGFYHYQHDNADMPGEPSVLADLVEPHFHFDQVLVTALTHITTNEHREVS